MQILSFGSLGAELHTPPCLITWTLLPPFYQIFTTPLSILIANTKCHALDIALALIRSRGVSESMTPLLLIGAILFSWHQNRRLTSSIVHLNLFCIVDNVTANTSLHSRTRDKTDLCFHSLESELGWTWIINQVVTISPPGTAADW